MGLDIYAYSKIKRIASLDDRDVKEGETFIYINPDFPRSADGLVKGIYTYESDFSFNAGSYSGYNEWRSKLANMIGKTDQEIWDTPVPGPFVELINNSDCDTVIGPETSKKLFEDFKKHYSSLAALPETEDKSWFIQKYGEWMNAFEIASNEGCVVFG